MLEALYQVGNWTFTFTADLFIIKIVHEVQQEKLKYTKETEQYTALRYILCLHLTFLLRRKTYLLFLAVLQYACCIALVDNLLAVFDTL